MRQRLGFGELMPIHLPGYADKAISLEKRKGMRDNKCPLPQQCACRNPEGNAILLRDYPW